jgi:hypothetical protein
MMKQPESQYQSYLLRLWRAGEGKNWRVVLEHVGTHERYGFADLDGLCTFLREQMRNEIQITNTFSERKRSIS